MTDDYLAISNTGKNITITMTPGMKYVLCDNLDRLRMVYSAGSAVFFPALPPDGYKLCKRKNVWNVSMASARCPDWPIHERAVYRMSQIEFQGGAGRVTLPKPALDMDCMLRSLPVHIRQDIPLPPPIHIDHPAMNRLETGDNFERKLRAELLRAADRPAHTDYRNMHRARIVDDEPKAKSGTRFAAADMVVAAITGACGGFMIAVLLAAAGVLK